MPTLFTKKKKGASMPTAKKKGFELYKALGSPKLLVAPMVDQSEYAWRILSRQYGADLCYTPMFHAKLFAESEKYRNEFWRTGPKDRPLIVQVVGLMLVLCQ